MKDLLTVLVVLLVNGVSCEECDIPDDLGERFRALQSTGQGTGLPHMYGIQILLTPSSPALICNDSNPVCALKTFNSQTPVNEKSTCPWEWKMDVDPNRFPMEIPMAHCLCCKCRDN